MESKIKTFFKDTAFEEIDLPEKIYKYRSWRNDTHKRVLTHQEIYFSSPLEFGDHHECSLERDFSTVTKSMLYQHALSYVSRRNKNRRSRREEARFLAKNSPITNKGYQQDFQTYFREKLNKEFSIFCASEHKDNYNLWQTFASDQEGFCVGFNSRRMFNNKEIFGSGGKITYYPTNDPPKLRPLCFTEKESIEDLTRVIFSLPNKYVREDEYRLAKIHLQAKEIELNKAAFDEVILGDRMLAEHKAEIIQLIKSNIPHVKVFQAKCNYDIEGYSFTQIDLNS